MVVVGGALRGVLGGQTSCEKCVETVREQEKDYRRRVWVWLPICFDISLFLGGRNGPETRLEVHDDHDADAGAYLRNPGFASR